jgi:hypothetical protein
VSKPSVAVVIPWRVSRTHKPRRLEVCIAALRAALPPKAGIRAFDSGHQPFNRAASRNGGVSESTADVLVVCDGDAVVQPAPLLAAVAAAGDGRLHLPYTEVRLLTQDGSEHVQLGNDPHDARVWHTNPYSVGGCVVVSRDTWRAAGGWDERFTNWGFEDTAFWAAVDTLLGTTRHEGTLYDLWHIDKRGIGSPQWQTGKALCDRYTDARGNPEAMRTLIEERVCASA